MPIHIQRREGENMNAFLYRFNKKIKHSGLVKEAKKRQFFKRAVNRSKRRLATLYRSRKQIELAREKKMGKR